MATIFRKKKAHQLIAYRMRKGLMKKRKCVVCGGTNFLRFHHEDYDYPLKVICLCGNCHSRLHSPDPEKFMPIYSSLFEKKKLLDFPQEKYELVRLFLEKADTVKLYLDIIQKFKRS